LDWRLSEQSRPESDLYLFAARRARSSALLAFGGDSAIELCSVGSSAVEISCKGCTRGRGKAGCPCRGSLVVDAGCYVAIISVATLLGYSEPKPTLLGVAILVAAAAVMPWLAKEKRRMPGVTGSAALRADAAQSALCAYLSLIALAEMAVNLIWRVKWADPLAALAIVPLIVWEGREAMRGKAGRPAAVASLPYAYANASSSRLHSRSQRGVISITPVVLVAHYSSIRGNHTSDHARVVSDLRAGLYSASDAPRCS